MIIEESHRWLPPAVTTLCCAQLIAFSVVSKGSAQEEAFEKRAAKIGLEHVVDIPLAGGTSRFDYQSIDDARRRLYIARLGGDMVTVVDIDSRKVVADIPDVPKPHGILAVPELNQVFVSATGKDEVYVIDQSSPQVVAKIPAGHYPDGLAFDPKSRKVFVSDEMGKTVAIIDPIAKSLVKKIDIGGEVGNTQYDPVSGLIYSADQSHDELVAIDPAKLEVAARYTLQGCSGPHGFYIDAATHFAIITGEGNASYLVFDLTEKKAVSHGSVGADPDVLAFDTALHRLYVSSESGVVSTFDVGKGNVVKVGEAFFAPHAHTVSVDQKTHLVFFPLQDIGGRPVLRVMKPRNQAIKE